MQRLQSRAVRLCLGWKRKDWSVTRGLEELGWLMAKCASIRGALKVLRAGNPGNLYDSLMSRRGELLAPTPESLNNMSKT